MPAEFNFYKQVEESLEGVSPLSRVVIAPPAPPIWVEYSRHLVSVVVLVPRISKSGLDIYMHLRQVDSSIAFSDRLPSWARDVGTDGEVIPEETVPRNLELAITDGQMYGNSETRPARKPILHLHKNGDWGIEYSEDASSNYPGGAKAILNTIEGLLRRGNKIVINPEPVKQANTS